MEFEAFVFLIRVCGGSMKVYESGCMQPPAVLFIERFMNVACLLHWPRASERTRETTKRESVFDYSTFTESGWRKKNCNNPIKTPYFILFLFGCFFLCQSPNFLLRILYISSDAMIHLKSETSRQLLPICLSLTPPTFANRFRITTDLCHLGHVSSHPLSSQRPPPKKKKDFAPHACSVYSQLINLTAAALLAFLSQLYCVSKEE